MYLIVMLTQMTLHHLVIGMTLKMLQTIQTQQMKIYLMMLSVIQTEHIIITK